MHVEDMMQYERAMMGGELRYINLHETVISGVDAVDHTVSLLTYEVIRVNKAFTTGRPYIRWALFVNDIAQTGGVVTS
jgi:hypothetical protein